MITSKNGTTFYCRLDWLTTDGVRAFDDCRVFIVGTEGSIELRKTVDPAMKERTDNVLILLDHHGEHRYCIPQGVETPYFSQLIQDSIHRTEFAMIQEHCRKAAELCVKASQQALRIV